MVGLNKYDGKKKREMRRRNHIARDLRTPKYKQRRNEDRLHKDEKYKDWMNIDDSE